jgi:hypothetical protein
MTGTGSGGTGLATRQVARAALSQSTPAMPMPCAVSGSRVNNNWRSTEYNMRAFYRIAADNASLAGSSAR